MLARAQPDLQVIDIDDLSFNEPEFTFVPFQGYPSAYGNQVIANAVFDGLGETAVSVRDPALANSRAENAR